MSQLQLTTAQKLYDQTMYKSSEIISSWIVSSNAAEPINHCALILLADSLAKTGQQKRSLKYYENAIIKGRPLMKKSLFYCLVQRYVDSCIQTKDHYRAKEALESINESKLTLPLLKQLALVYDHFGEVKRAISTYKSILEYFLLTRKQPDALEALEALVKYNLSWDDIKVLVSDPDIQMFAAGLFESNQCSPKALEIYTELGQKYPFNYHIVLHIADCHLKEGNTTLSHQYFTKLRRIDPDIIDQMDVLTSLVQAQGILGNVQKLVEQLLQISETRPEPWVAMAILSQMKDANTDALIHVDKALGIDNSHVFGHQVRGSILIALERPEDAILAFRNAYRFTRDILSYEGLAHCYIRLNRITDAFATAKECMALLPTSARAYSLQGLVLTHMAGHEKKGQEHLQKALKMSPHCIEAVFGLCDLLTRTGKEKEAIQLLESQLDQNHSDVIHTRLGQLFITTQEYPQALKHFNTALGINPESGAAKKGHSQTSRLMHGEEEQDPEEWGDEEQDEGVDSMDEFE